MTKHRLKLDLLPDFFAVYRLDKDAVIPVWALAGDFFSITRTADEVSVVCPQSFVPEGIRCEKSWRCLRVAGTMDFSMIGVVASLVMPLAETGISVFVVSTFDTDYFLVKESNLGMALVALRGAGHEVGSVKIDEPGKS